MPVWQLAIHCSNQFQLYSSIIPNVISEAVQKQQLLSSLSMYWAWIFIYGIYIEFCELQIYVYIIYTYICMHY